MQSCSIGGFSDQSNVCHRSDVLRMTLDPGGSTLSNPKQFFRSEGFTITSAINLGCNNPSTYQFQWTVRTCTTSCSNPVEFGDNFVTTSTELYIPSRMLAYGIYQIELQVTVINASESVYIQINPSPIVPNLLQFGTAMITIGHEQDLTFNPGLFSIDPDEDTFNSNVSINCIQLS